MAEDIKKDNELNEEEEFFNDEEYQKALDALNSSKGSRVKDVKQKKAQAKKDSDAKKGPKKKDPITIACFIAIPLFIVAVVVYFVWIYGGNDKGLGFKTEELQLKYEATSIYNGSFLQYGVNIPEVTYSDVTDDVEKVSYKYKYFNALLDTSKIPGSRVALAVEGRELSNGYVKQMNAIARLDPTSITDDDFSLCTIYFACMLQTFYPELSDNDAVLLVTEAISTMKDPGYYVYNDIAYRVSLVSATENDPYLYVKMEFISRSDIGKGDTIIAQAAAKDAAQ